MLLLLVRSAVRSAATVAMGDADAAARPALFGGRADAVFVGVAVDMERLEFVRRSSWVS